MAASLLLMAVTAAAMAKTGESPVRLLHQPPRYELSPINHLSLKVAPSLGTQLYFPFVLDQVDSVVPFTVNVTNSEVFMVRINQERNFILISVPPDADRREIGSLFIVVADRHLNIRLGIGTPSEHTEAVYFTFNDEVQTELIDKAVAKARGQLEREMDERIEAVKKQSRRAAIAYVAELAQSRPRKSSLRETFVGEHHRLYLPKVWEYPGFSIVFAEISGQSKTAEAALRIDEISLKVEGGSISRKAEGYLRCQAEDGEQLCTAVFDKLGDWKNYERIEIEIQSNRGLDSFVY